ncbi:MAG: ATP-dependent DNA helicase RecQ, partial [uncultured Solirubrobacteraceae bacterium]
DHRHRQDRPRRPGGLRLRGAETGPARGDRVGALRSRHAGGHVDRIGQVGDLPDRRPAFQGRHRGRLAADRAAGRPGRRPPRAPGRERRPSQLDPFGSRARGGARRPGRRRARVPLPRARAARERRRPLRARRRRHLAAGRRRGP